MNLTITNDKILTKEDINLYEALNITNVDIEMNVKNFVHQKGVATLPKVIITAELTDLNVSTEGTVLLDFCQLNDENLLYIFEELEEVMREKGLMK